MENIEEVYNLKNVNRGYFRMLIFGASNSGKSTFLLRKLWPILTKKYEKVILISPEFNHTQYRKVIGNKLTFKSTECGTKEIIAYITALKEGIIKNMQTGETKSGIPTYKYNTLLIFDDVYIKNLNKDDNFISIFSSFRHIQVSTIYLAQNIENMTTPTMRINSTFIVYFRLPGRGGKTAIKDIGDQLFINDDKERTAKAFYIYKERVLNIKYGCIILDIEKTKIYISIK